MKRSKCILFCFAVFAINFSSIAHADMCTYTTYSWNTLERKAVDFKSVRKPYNQLEEYEIDSVTQCTVCSEDQVLITIPAGPSFKVCRYIAEDVEAVILNSLKFGQLIQEVEGYRVGKTKGEVDAFGNRTQFSNHSFGTAIDLNASHNGLYDRCVQFDSSCRLIKGGHWNVLSDYSIKQDDVLVQEMKRMGFNWGGQIIGRQKDFMHFSISGY